MYRVYVACEKHWDLLVHPASFGAQCYMAEWSGKVRLFMRLAEETATWWFLAHPMLAQRMHKLPTSVRGDSCCVWLMQLNNAPALAAARPFCLSTAVTSMVA